MKILFLSYYLNTEKNVGAIRASKFIKYLNRIGHKLYVFSSEKTDLECEKLQVKPLKLKGGNKFYQVADDNSKLQKVIVNLKVLLKDILYSPDKQIWWNITMIKSMARSVRYNDIDIAITTGSPFSTFVSLYILKKLCAIPIILDFRDPWEDSITMNKQSVFRKLNVRFWEKVCVKNADGLIAVNDSIAEKIKSYKPKGIVQAITNGFDPEDFNSTEQVDENGEFTFLYTGKYSILREDYDPTTIFEAFKQFKIAKPNNSILKFIGPTDQETLDFSTEFAQYGLVCETEKPKHEIIRIQKNANVLIQFYYPHNYHSAISLKIYEYVYQKKLILSFNEKKGILYDFLRDNGFGYTVSSHDVKNMSTLFADSCEEKLKHTNYEEKEINLIRFNYQNLTNKLNIIIKEIKERANNEKK